MHYQAHNNLRDTFHSNFLTTIIFFNNVHTEENKTILVRTFSKTPSELTMLQYNAQPIFQEIPGGGKKYCI
jgi:hypothetical protein